MQPFYVCRECGGSEVWILNWTDPNTDTIVPGEPYHLPGAGGVFDHAGNLSHSWCNTCGEHTTLLYIGPEAQSFDEGYPVAADANAAQGVINTWRRLAEEGRAQRQRGQTGGKA